MAGFHNKGNKSFDKQIDSQYSEEQKITRMSNVTTANDMDILRQIAGRRRNKEAELKKLKRKVCLWPGMMTQRLQMMSSSWKATVLII